MRPFKNFARDSLMPGMSEDIYTGGWADGGGFKEAVFAFFLAAFSFSISSRLGFFRLCVFFLGVTPASDGTDSFPACSPSSMTVDSSAFHWYIVEDFISATIGEIVIVCVAKARPATLLPTCVTTFHPVAWSGGFQFTAGRLLFHAGITELIASELFNM
jgi:hypothetical protein